MRLTGFDGVTFAELGLTVSTANLGVGSPRSPVLVGRRNDGPLYVGVEQDALTVPTSMIVKTQVDIETAVQRVLGKLGVDNPALRTLTCELADGTVGVADASVGSWRHGDVNELVVDFVIPAGAWRRATPRSSGPMALRANAAIALRNEGRKVARPTLDLYWRGAVQRTSKSAATGWEWVVPVTLTNNGSRTLVNTAVQLGPFNTATRVGSGLMLASGNDLRVYRNGREIRRDVFGIGTDLAFVWIVPDPLAAGQSHTYDLVYGNPLAGSPPTLQFGTDPQRPAFDITGTQVLWTSSMSTSLTQTGANWEVDQWAGATYVSSDGQHRKVKDNTASTINLTRALSSAASGTDKVVLTKSGYKGDGGICSSSTVSSLTDGTRTGTAGEWIPNEWKGGTIEITSGTGSGQVRTIASNGLATVNTSSNWTTAPDGTSRYRLVARNKVMTYDTRIADRNSSPARGLWTLNQGQVRPSQVRFDAPGAWYRGVYRRNTDSYSQPRAVGENVGGSDVDYFSTLHLQRSREGKAGAQEEVGLADSVMLASVFPLTTLRAGYLFRNDQLAGDPTKGMCRALIGVQEASGDEWDIVDDHGLPHASSTAYDGYLDLTEHGSPLRLLHALIPQLGDEIPDEDNNTALWRSDPAHPCWQVDVDSSSLAVTDLSSATAFSCYDLDLVYRLGGGLTAAKPYKQVAVGGSAGKVFLRNNEGVRLDAENLTAEKLDGSGVKLASLGHLIRPADIILNRYGQTKSLIPDDWLPVPFGENLLANGSFDVDASGWARDALAANLTATDGRVTSQSRDTPGSLELRITANASGVLVNTALVWLSGAYTPVVAGAAYLVALWMRAEQTTLRGYAQIYWYTAAQAFISASATTSLATPTANAWTPQAIQEAAPSNAAFARVRLVAYNLPVGVTGAVQFDAVFLGRAESRQVLHVSDPSGAGWGELELSVSMPEGGYY